MGRGFGITSNVHRLGKFPTVWGHMLISHQYPTIATSLKITRQPYGKNSGMKNEEFLGHLHMSFRRVLISLELLTLTNGGV